MTQSAQTPEKPAPGTQLGDPNDTWDGAWVETEWKPRPRPRTIGEVEWLARMSDKARAKAKGTIGDYIYPCPADKKLLDALELDPDTFQKLAVAASGDDELVTQVKSTSPAFKENRFSFTRQQRPAQAPAVKGA
ncbi:MAG: DUF5069 domain-containing protein [Chloroflexota bacterium]